MKTNPPDLPGGSLESLFLVSLLSQWAARP